MRRYLVIGLIIGILIGSGLVYVLFFPPLKKPGRLCSIQVGTFYYVWYNSSTDGYSWEEKKICDEPVLGYYNSCESEIIKHHLVWMSDLWIDFAVVSWWGPYSQSGWHSFVNSAVHQVFRIARENMVNVKLCVMVEPFSETGDSTYNYSEIYDYVYSNFVTPCPTIYYEYLDKPLICFYNNDYLTSSGVVPSDDRFTMRIVGNKHYADWVYTDLVPIEGRLPRNRQFPVTPRFDDTRFKKPGHVIDKDLCEGVYDEQWQRAIDYAGNDIVDVVTICSWNEYPERTAIEPHWDADAYDHNPYFLYNKTESYITELKTKYSN